MGNAYAFCCAATAWGSGDTQWVDQSGNTLSGDVTVQIKWSKGGASLNQYAALRGGHNCGLAADQAGAQAKFSACTQPSTTTTTTTSTNTTTAGAGTAATTGSTSSTSGGGCQSGETNNMAGSIVPGGGAVIACIAGSTTTWRQSGNPVSGTVRVDACKSGATGCESIKGKCYTVSNGIAQQPALSTCPSNSVPQASMPSGGTSGGGGGGSSSSTNAATTAAGAALTGGESGGRAGGLTSGETGDACPAERRIPAPQRGSFNNAECCAADYVWDSRVYTCTVNTRSCPVERQIPPDQQSRYAGAICCAPNERWNGPANKCYLPDTSEISESLYSVRDEDILEAYYRIANEVGTVDQQYILQPKESIVQALIALCLTAIRMFLLQIVRILKQLKMCFESILYTGDGAAGQCEAIVSQYICDLIIEAISCFMRRFAGGGRTGDESSGIGNFMGAVSDANTEVMGDITDRYGDENIFTEQFSTSSIMHGICIWAFTGEWPSNFGALLDSAMEVPVQSFASVFPAERRFQAFDLEGNPVFTYHVGLSFFAGAPTTARLELVCSGEGVFCREGGREMDKCDCAEMGEKVMSVSLSQCKPSCSDMFRYDQSCSTECFVKVERTPYRYDRARVVWQYTGGQTTAGIAGPVQGMTSPNPEALSGSEDHEINEVAGPPLGFCHFDATELRYTCGFGQTADAYGRIVNIQLAPPEGQQAGAEPIYRKGDRYILNIDAVVKTPEKLLERCDLGDCEATKYLTVVIRNQRGAVVWPPGYTASPAVTSTGFGYMGATPQTGPQATTDTRISLPPALRLNGNMRFQLAFFDALDFEGLEAKPFVIDDEKFIALPAASTTTAAGGVGGFGSGPSCFRGTICDVPVICDVNTVSNEEQGTDKGVRLSVREEPAGSGIKKIKLQRGKRKTYSESRVELSPEGAETECALIGTELKCDEYSFQFSGTINQLAVGKSCVVFFSEMPTPTSTGGATGAQTCNPLTPETWTAEIVMYNAQLDGTSWVMSPQITISPDGTPQQFRVPFRVSCASVGTTGAGREKISQIGSRSVTFTPERNSDYGVTVRNMEAGESVVMADYSTVGGSGFSIKILVGAMIADIDIDVSKEGWNALSEVLSVTKEGAGAPIGKCTETEGPAGPQPRPCYTTSDDGKFMILHLRRGDPLYTLTGFVSIGYEISVEGEQCKPPNEGGLCVYPDMWNCTNDAGETIEFAATGSCVDGQNCCGSGSLSCCPTGKVVPKYGLCSDSTISPPGICVDNNRFKCLEGAPTEAGFGTASGTSISFLTGKCPGQKNNIKCCPTGNYKFSPTTTTSSGAIGTGGTGAEAAEAVEAQGEEVPTIGIACDDACPFVTERCECTCGDKHCYISPGEECRSYTCAVGVSCGDNCVYLNKAVCPAETRVDSSEVGDIVRCKSGFPCPSESVLGTLLNIVACQCLTPEWCPNFGHVAEEDTCPGALVNCDVEFCKKDDQIVTNAMCARSSVCTDLKGTVVPGTTGCTGGKVCCNLEQQGCTMDPGFTYKGTCLDSATCGAQEGETVFKSSTNCEFPQKCCFIREEKLPPELQCCDDGLYFTDYSDITGTGVRMWFKLSNGAWQWSFDPGQRWMPTSTHTWAPNPSSTLKQTNMRIVDYLQNVDFTTNFMTGPLVNLRPPTLDGVPASLPSNLLCCDSSKGSNIYYTEFDHLSRMWFRHITGVWQWSFDKQNWQPVTTYDWPHSSATLKDQNRRIIDYLRSHNPSP
ncbi:MAG: hypothetical protein KJ574_02650 [Nanoarchaeota archaeon]|nr:hypothetical protein [Nanoarchaeota archaeon]